MPAWLSHLTDLPEGIKVPPEATAITPPLVANNWEILLANHPNGQLTDFFIKRILQGFRNDFKQPLKSLVSAKRNLSCALQHPDTVEEYLADEIAHGRVAGPFQKEVIPAAHISRFGVIPKHHQPNKWRLIVDLSHPVNCSVNGGIPKELRSLTYITVDSAVAAWLSRKKATKREILLLVGLLQHATKVVKLGRTFVARMYSEATELKNILHATN